MKLNQALVVGRFAGLHEVEECLNYIDMHYWDCIPRSEWTKERSELYNEYWKYKCGEVELDEVYIAEGLKRLGDELKYQKYYIPF